MSQQNKTFGETLAAEMGRGKSDRAAKREKLRLEMENDPRIQQQIQQANDAVLGERSGQMSAPADWPGSTSLGEGRPNIPEPAVRAPAPPLNQPPIGKPTVPGEPVVRGRGGRGGGGMPQRGGARPDAAQPPARQINPLQLSPGSPWKFARGGPADFGQDYRKKVR